jgi:hypothetical protein
MKWRWILEKRGEISVVWKRLLPVVSCGVRAYCRALMRAFRAPDLSYQPTVLVLVLGRFPKNRVCAIPIILVSDKGFGLESWESSPNQNPQKRLAEIKYLNIEGREIYSFYQCGGKNK